MSDKIKVKLNLKSIKLDGSKEAGPQIKLLREQMEVRPSCVCRHAGLESSYSGSIEKTVSITPLMMAYAKGLGAESIIIDLKNVTPWQGQTIPTV